ncbi:MAG TPA: PKD-like domain-containing protein, partial [Chitinophagaceae bacterium]|nr:PKD-like domain-containing protein [Chitinophagaceae bacterium]
MSKHSFRNFLHKRKKLFIALLVMGFGVFMVGQTVPNNFFKKIFTAQKTSVAKDSVASKQKKPRIRVVKKPVVVDQEEKTLTPSITCKPDQVICLVNTTSYTHSGTTWDPTGTSDITCPGTPTFSYTSTGPVNPTTGTTLNNAVFSAGIITITWTINDPCNNTASCPFTITVYPDLDPGAHNTNPVISCVGYNPAQLDINTPPPSGGSLPYTYQWQINGVNIGAPSLPSYDPPAIASSGVYNYNCVITDQCGRIVSTPVKTITIVDDPVVTASGGGAVCQNSNPTLTGNITGGTGPMNFQWQSGTTSTGPWTDIPGATSSNYLPPTSPGIYYYRVELSPNVASCNNSSSTITLTVNPTPTVVDPADQIVCNNTATTAVNFTGAVPGTTFDWTNNTPSIGLAASGSGNIAAFTATNASTTPVTATITVTPTANGCPGTPQTFTITVNPTPTVADPADQIVCNNTATTTVNFTGTVAGTTYNWTNNTTSIGLAASGSGNIAAFTATNVTAAPVTATITVTPTANGCQGTPQTFTITVNPTIVPSVTIAANPGNNICAGTPVIFTATPTNPGATPSYQWQVNGVPTGTNSPTFTSSTLANTDKVTVIMTSSATCPSPASVTSNQITMTVNALITPSVTIGASATTICLGNSVTFTATPINGGASPSYQWQVNGVNAGTNSPTFTTSTLANGDVVHVILTSNAPCATPTTAASTGIPITVNPIPTATAPANQTYCNGVPTTAIALTGTPAGVVFDITGGAAIGLANQTGVTSIPSFTPITGGPTTITITPRANGCTGTAVTYTITVNPTPTATAPANQTYCNGVPTSAIALTGAPAGVVFDITGGAAIGLANQTGVTSIPSFTPITGGPTTITITPRANGCTGTAVT